METAGEEEQDGLSIHSPGQAPPSSASSLPKEHTQVDLELRVLEALEIYPPAKLQGVHRHFVLYGLMEFLRRSFDRHFSADEILQLLDQFFNLEMLEFKSMLKDDAMDYATCTATVVKRKRPAAPRSSRGAKAVQAKGYGSDDDDDDDDWTGRPRKLDLQCQKANGGRCKYNS